MSLLSSAPSTSLALPPPPAPGSASAPVSEGEVGADTEVLERVRPASTRRSVPRPISRLAGVVLVLALWQYLCDSGVITPDVVGSPTHVAREAGHLISTGALPDAIGASVQRVLLGLLLGGSIALTLAVVSGVFRWGEDLVDAPVQMLRTVPLAGLVPLLIVWLGVGEAPKIVLIGLGAGFPLYINVLAGIRLVDPGLIEMGNTLGLSRRQLLRRIVLPAALPNALVGLRIALGTSWLALVFAEQISATSGLGYLMSTAQELLQTDTIVVCLVTYACLGLLADLIVRGLERRLLRWQPRFAGGAR